MASCVRDYLNRHSLILRFIISFFITQIIIVVILALDKSPLYNMQLFEKATTYISYNIAIFAFIEGVSTFNQSRQFEIRNKIDDLRNELEKAYGPLYSLLNQIGRDIRYDTDVDWANQKIYALHILANEKEKLDNILSRYPHMFPHDIYSFWREFLQNPRKELNPQRDEYLIPTEFIEMINRDYNNKLQEHNRLINK